MSGDQVLTAILYIILGLIFFVPMFAWVYQINTTPDRVAEAANAVLGLRLKLEFGGPK